MRSAWRGEGRKTSAPNRATSKRDAAMDIISMAQQASLKPSGQMELLRAQFTALSSWVKMMPSSCSSLPKSSGFVRVMLLPRYVSMCSSLHFLSSHRPMPLTNDPGQGRALPAYYRGDALDENSALIRATEPTAPP